MPDIPEEALQAAAEAIGREYEIECGECMGSGEVGNDDEACLHCHGTGNAPEDPGWEMPGHSYWKTCPVCERTETDA